MTEPGSGDKDDRDDEAEHGPMAHRLEARPGTSAPEGPPRPLVERLGMASIAVVLGALFGGVSFAAFAGGEVFLGVMGAVGCLMTLWVGALTLFRG